MTSVIIYPNFFEIVALIDQAGICQPSGCSCENAPCEHSEHRGKIYELARELYNREQELKGGIMIGNYQEVTDKAVRLAKERGHEITLMKKQGSPSWAWTEHPTAQAYKGNWYVAGSVSPDGQITINQKEAQD